MSDPQPESAEVGPTDRPARRARLPRTPKEPAGSGAPERLHKRIAAAGVCSRREAERRILEGRVTVNGQIVREMGRKVGPEDEVRVDDQPLPTVRRYYLLLNKPTGVVTTMRDPQGRRTVVDLVPDYGIPLKPVGRLDIDTEGAIILTNDGDFAQLLAHPSHGIEKEYSVTVAGELTPKDIRRLEEGVSLDGRRTAPARVKNVFFDRRGGRTSFRIVIHEGRNRQIRRMCEAVGHEVLKLKRNRIGSVDLHKLPVGGCRLLGQVEVEALRREALDRAETNPNPAPGPKPRRSRPRPAP
ncbi:MAG: pseudouridine synthase [Fimbriimonadaceae bacterium]